MKICQVYGDMSSEKSSENYPTDLFCEECFEGMSKDGENADVVNYENDNGSFGDTCSACGKTKQEEDSE